VKPGFEQPIDAEIYKKTISFFEQLVQLLHPFMPFVTEEIYHRLGEKNDDLCVKQFSLAKKIDPAILKQGELLKQTISSIRDTRVKNDIKPKDPIKLHIQTAVVANYRSIESILSKQANAETISYVTNAVDNTIAVMIGKDKFYIETETIVDTTAQKEQMQKDLHYLKGFLLSVEKKLSNERFVQNAKPKVVEIERTKKRDAEEKIKAIEESLAGLG
jgi:valyl-tRNA synthetase